MSTEFIKGGRGSGNFNHVGRPGEVGGSGGGAEIDSPDWKIGLDGQRKTITASVNGKQVGYADISVSEDGECFIEMIEVHPNEQGKGYGKDLMRQVLKEAIHEGSVRISGESISEQLRGIMDKWLGTPHISGNTGFGVSQERAERYLEDPIEGVHVWYDIPKSLRSYEAIDNLKSLKATPSSNFSGVVWNPYMRQFVPVSGKPVDTSGTRKIVDEVRRLAAGRMNKLANRLKDGDLTNTAEFAIDFRDELKNLFTTVHILARGGLDAMDSSDWGMLGQSLKEQYSYANSMVRDIENGLYGIKDDAGEVIIRDTGIPELGDAFINRVDMYTSSSWGASGEFENVVRDREMALGSLEARMLGDSKESCQECIEQSEMGFQPPGILKDIGDTECLTTGHSRVLCKRGWVPISEIVVGDYVFTHKLRWRKVTATAKRVAEPDRKCFEVLAPTNELVGCTADHKWLTDDGWKQAEEINESELSIQQAEVAL